MPQKKKVTKSRAKAKPSKAKFGNKILSTKLLVFVAAFAVVGGYLLIRSFAAASSVLTSQNLDTANSVNAAAIVETTSKSKKNNQVIQLANTSSSTNARATLANSKTLLDAGVYKVCVHAYVPSGTVTGGVLISTYAGGKTGTVLGGSTYTLAQTTDYTDAVCFSVTNSTSNTAVAAVVTNSTANGKVRIGNVNINKTGSIPPPPPSPGSGQPPAAVTGGSTWKSIFNDNFDGSSVNTSNWTVVNNSTYGDGNDERQRYMASNVSVSGGTIKLMGKKQATTASEYTSGMITTKSWSNDGKSNPQKFKFKHGYAEIKAKLPKGGGYWPAFWLVGADTAPGWPAYGEIDVFEGYGTYPCCIEQTFHWNNGGHKQEGGQSRKVSSTAFPEDNTGWHTYGVHWTASKLDFYIDGVKTQTFTAKDSGATAALGYEHTIHVNLAIGGSGPEKYHGWDGSDGGDWKTGELPGTYEVDYVKVWQ